MHRPMPTLPSTQDGEPLTGRSPGATALLLALTACGPALEASTDPNGTVEQDVVVCAAGPTVRGLDVSTYQGHVDWNAVHGAGWEYAVTRIGDGYGGDNQFAANWAGIKAAGMIRGAYQFFRAANDPVQMADIVVNAVGRLGPGDLPVMLDFENASIQGQSPAVLRQKIDTWLSRVEAGTGKRPLIYTGYYVWDPYVQSNAYGSYPLWIAAYGPNNGSVPAMCPNIPSGWGKWSFWQYTSVGAVPGINTDVDKNLFNGTLSDLQTLANGITDDNCFGNEAQGCGNFGCGCVDHQCNGVFCPGSGCSAQHTANCGAFGAGCADGQCAGGTAPGSGCTAKESMDCAKFGCGCVDHQCNGGACAGTGCTWRETHDCGGFGVNCADHQCSGGYGPGTGCTLKETNDCKAQGCGCVDHKCSGGNSCAGSGSTARNALDCGMFGCHSVDGQCSGGFCPGSGCTGKETNDCAARGCGCVDEVCSGGACMGTGCTARQALECGKLDAGCSRGACITPTGPVIVDAGRPMEAPDAGQPFMPEEDGGTGGTMMMPMPMPTSDAGSHRADAGQLRDPVMPEPSHCAAAPFGPLLVAALTMLRRRNRSG
ncbi:MAG: hypothetical protein IPJ65_41925 [Archangiaceae bacterium]|nr:hypothetical protein [Archangiaceae bacterium]